MVVFNLYGGTRLSDLFEYFSHISSGGLVWCVKNGSGTVMIGLLTTRKQGVLIHL